MYADLLCYLSMYGDGEDALCACGVVVFVRVDAHQVLQKNQVHACVRGFEAVVFINKLV